jgi:hypothetical protein
LISAEKAYLMTEKNRKKSLNKKIKSICNFIKKACESGRDNCSICQPSNEVQEILLKEGYKIKEIYDGFYNISWTKEKEE